MPYRFVESFRAGPGWSCSKTVYKPALMSHLTMRILIKCTSYSAFLHFVSYSLIIMSAIYTLLTNLFYSLPVFPFTASDLRLCILLQHSRTRNLISDYSQHYMSHVSAYVFGNFVTKRDKNAPISFTVSPPSSLSANTSFKTRIYLSIVI
jgi:hypothetical protein